MRKVGVLHGVLMYPLRHTGSLFPAYQGEGGANGNKGGAGASAQPSSSAAAGGAAAAAGGPPTYMLYDDPDISPVCIYFLCALFVCLFDLFFVVFFCFFFWLVFVVRIIFCFVMIHIGLFLY